MRIVVIGYFHGDGSQNGVRIAQAWQLQGHNVKCYNFKIPHIEEIILADKKRPDFVLVTMGKDIDHIPFRRLRDEGGCFLANWIPDEYGPQEEGGTWLESIKGVYDLLLLETRGLVPLLRDYAKEAIWVPQFFDPLYHMLRAAKPPKNSWDVGFLGGPNIAQSSVRLQFLKNLNNAGYKLKLPAKQILWKIPPELPKILEGCFISDSMVIGADMAGFYSHTKVGVNFLNDKLPQYELALSNRVFKTIGCGCFALTPEIEGLEDLLISGEHCATYQGMNYEDFKCKLDYYLTNDQEREHIAKIGRDHVLKNFNIDKVTRGFIDEIRKRL